MKVTINIKRTFATALVALTSLALTSLSGAVQLTLVDAYYLGSINDGTPPSDAHELSWLNEVIGMTLGTTNQASTDPTGELLSRSSNNFGTLPAASNGVKQEDSGNRTATATSAYVLGKYGNSSTGQIIHLWYVGDLAETTVLDLSTARAGLSHTTLFAGTSRIPDGGSTVALFGFSLLGLAGLRRAAARRKA